jgi:hypothetical protein
MRRTMAGGLMVLGLIALGGWNQMARAEVGQGGGFTDYGNYPPTMPAGCPGGPGALLGVSFAAGGQVSGDLAGLALTGSDTVTMSWDSVAEGCARLDGQPAVAVTLASHETATGSFDIDEDQLLLNWASCGPGDPCTRDDGGRYLLTLTLPSGAVACHAQIDAVVGPPLGVVGPSGSYYTAGLRPNGGPTTLLAAGVAHTQPCEETPDTTAPEETIDTTPDETTDTTPDETIENTPDETIDTTPDTTSDEETTTDSTLPEESESNPGAQASNPATPAQEPLVALPATTATDLVSVESNSPVQPATSVLGVTASRADLPTTGARTDELVVAAAGLIVLGAIARAAGARVAQRRHLRFQPGV